MNFEVIKAMAEFDEKMKNIKEEEKQKEIEKGAKQLYKVYDAFIKAGFSQAMAENIILLIFKKGLNGDNNE